MAAMRRDGMRLRDKRRGGSHTVAGAGAGADAAWAVD